MDVFREALHVSGGSVTGCVNGGSKGQTTWKPGRSLHVGMRSMSSKETSMATALAAAEEMRGWTMRTAELEFSDDQQEERFRENSFQTARASVDPRQANVIGLLNGAASPVLQ